MVILFVIFACAALLVLTAISYTNWYVLTLIKVKRIKNIEYDLIWETALNIRNFSIIDKLVMIYNSTQRAEASIRFEN